MMIERLQTKRSWQVAGFAALLLVLVLLLLQRALFPPASLVLGEGYDMRGAYYLWHAQAKTAVLSGQLPTWDPYLFAGYPYLVNPQANFFYPPAWLTVILPVTVGISWYAVFHFWIGGLGMFLFARFMRGSWLSAALAGLAFAFSAFMTARVWAGHLVPLATHVWMPWIALGTVWSVRQGRWGTAVLAAIPFALSILAGHTTTLLYVGLIWGLWVLYLLLTAANRWLVLRQALIIAGMALALGAIQNAALLQFSLLSTRVADPSLQFATDYSLPPAHLITLLIPDYFGEPVRSGYWSVPTFVELSIYTGILPLLGLILALRRPSRLTWFYLVVLLTGILLALGNYGFLYELFYKLLPPFQLARAPGRASFLYVFAISGLLSEALVVWRDTQTAEPETKAALARLMRWTLLVGGVIGVAALAATGGVFITVHPTDTSGRLWHQVGGWALALTFWLSGGVLLWGYLTTPSAGRRLGLAIGLMGLLVTDLWLFGYKMVVMAPTAPEALWVDARQIIGDTEARILPWGITLFWQNTPGAVGLRSVFGYNSLETADFEQFVASVPDPRAATFDILGAVYVVSQVPLDGFTSGERPLTLLGQTANAFVYTRGRRVPIARLVYQAELIPDRAATLARIHAADFDPQQTVIVSETPACELTGPPETPGTAEILAHADTTWRIQTNTPTPAMLVLSETAYPGWQVTIDGQPATWQKAYTLVRAVCVPAGEHVVTWEFAPQIYVWGSGLTLLAVGLVVCSGLGQWRRPA